MHRLMREKPRESQYNECPNDANNNGKPNPKRRTKEYKHGTYTNKCYPLIGQKSVIKE